MASKTVACKGIQPARICALQSQICVKGTSARALSYSRRTNAQSPPQPSLSTKSPPPTQQASKAASQPPPATKTRPKTMAELDEELKSKLEGISGEGGSSGIEYEGGKAVALKRGVKDNMFRVI